MYCAFRAAEAIGHALEGDSEALSRYASLLGGIHEGYLKQRSLLYQAEKRWAEAPFWQGAGNRADQLA